MNHHDPWPSNPALQRDWQMRRLRRYLGGTVLPFSAHYRSLFAQEGITIESLRTMDDLRKIPFTSKLAFLPGSAGADPVRDFVLIPDRAVLSKRPTTILKALVRGRTAVADSLDREFRPIFLTSTTGRSAEPVPFLYTNYDIDNLSIAGRRVMEVCGAEKEMKILNLFPFAPHLAFWLTHYASTAFGVFVLGTGGGKVMGTDGNLRLIRKIKPDVIVGMPTFLYHVLNELGRDGFALPNLRKIVLGGEKAPGGMRRKLRELAANLGAPNVDVLSVYGFTEAKLAWAECPYSEDSGSSGYHVHPDLALIEIVDPKTGDPVGENEPGEIVFTSLDARGSVVLRYRTGDCIDGGICYEPCPYCGRRVPRLVGELSRRSDVKDMQFDKLKGTLVDFNQLEHVLDNAEHIGTWQIEIRKRHDDPCEVDELVLHATKSDDTPEDILRAKLDTHFAAGTEVHLNRIEFHSEEELRHRQGVGVQIKEQRVVDHRPGAVNPATKAGIPTERKAHE